MEKHITASRLAPIKQFFQTKSESDLMGCYSWSQAVAAGLLPLFADFEVSLRNALHRALSSYYGNSDSYGWMIPVLNPAYLANAALPQHIAPHNMGKTARDDISSLSKKIKGRKCSGYTVTPDDIVAGLSFGFWEVLINSLDHRKQPKKLQGSILSLVFPHAPVTSKSIYGDAAFKRRVVQLLARIRDARNRVGHHDSLWTLPEFDEHGNTGFIARRPRHTIASLRLFAARLSWLAGWIDPAVEHYIRNSDHWLTYQALLSREALAIYRRRGGCAGTYQEVLNRSSLILSPTTGAPSFLKRLEERSFYY